MTQSAATHYDIRQIKKSLSALLAVCSTIGGNRHKEAIVAVVSRYRTASNYTNISIMAGSMMRYVGALLEPPQEFKEKLDTEHPDAKARMKIFNIVYDWLFTENRKKNRLQILNLPYTPELRDSAEKKLVQALNEYIQSEASTFTEPEALKIMATSIPAALRKYENEAAVKDKHVYNVVRSRRHSPQERNP